MTNVVKRWRPRTLGMGVRIVLAADGRNVGIEPEVMPASELISGLTYRSLSAPLISINDG